MSGLICARCQGEIPEHGRAAAIGDRIWHERCLPLCVPGQGRTEDGLVGATGLFVAAVLLAWVIAMAGLVLGSCGS